MADATDRGCEGPYSASAKFKRILRKRVIIKDRPSPADDCVGVQMRTIGQLEFIHKSLSQRMNCRQVIDAKGVRRAHRGDYGGDRTAGRQLLAGRDFQSGEINGVVALRGNTDHILLADAEPTGDRGAGIVSLL